MKQSLSPKNLAMAIGVSESSLKRWADSGRIEVSRTVGGHRKIAFNEAIRFIRDAEMTVVRPEILGIPELKETATSLKRSDEDPALVLEKLLSEGAAPQARGVIIGLYMSGSSVAEICDGPISHAMGKIGSIWQHSDEGIFIEHRATEICAQAINQLRLLLEPASETSRNLPVAVGGCPSGDYGALASMMVAVTLLECGYEAVNLGANTPMVSMLNAVQQYRPKLTYMACTHSGFLPARVELDQLSNAMSELQGCVVLGGHAAERAYSAIEGNIYLHNSMTALSGFARGLIAT
ncbi:MerR family transcriptional regulator [Mucisphaera calidilacus]|uniref:Uncharacterized protein n=1 Tax=Mucisphaera calidilacus TaxID=2527982 RepID=A0A518C128_9BACT|nr:hypothetical protein [Mucisphaera calidilacus]QDU72931.1 hypothetical protein Pan265_28070 [Mucisphaera calidilacus]